MKIRNQIALISITIFLIVCVFLGVAIGLYTSNVVRGQFNSYLSSSGRARAEHVRTFLNDQKETALILAAASVYRDFLKSPKDPVIISKIDKRLKRTIEISPEIIEAFILDKNGVIIASSDKRYVGLDKSKDSYFLEGQKGAYIKEPYYSETLNKISYTVSAPVLDDDGQILGVSVLRYDPKKFYALVSGENGLGETEENFLLDSDKYFLTPSRFLGEEVVLKKQAITVNSTACFSPSEVAHVKANGYAGLSAKQANLGVFQFIDYRQVSVIGTHFYIPETNWCLITKVDQSELTKIIFRLALILTIFFLLTAGLFFLVSYLVVNRLFRTLKSLEKGVEEIERGNYDIQVGQNGRDEISQLSRSFDAMIKAVKESRKDIDLKVAEQTKELTARQKDLANQKIAILNVLEDSQLLTKDLAKFKLAVDNASDHIVITDVEGIVLYANQAAEKITGYSGKEAIGKKAGALWRLPMPKEYYEELWRTIKTEKKTFNSKLQNKRKNGEIYTAQISISPVLDEKGAVIFFVGLERDITKEDEVDKAKTEFVSFASHQLRTPLSAIRWHVELLLSDYFGPMNEKQKKYLSEIYHSDLRMIELVSALLNVSRIDLGSLMIEPKPADLKNIFKQVLEDVQDKVKEKKLTMVDASDADIPMIPLDQKLISIVIQNLLSNATKYTPEGGMITWSVKLADPLLKKMPAGEKYFLITVKDSGIGIPEEFKAKIFGKLSRAENAREADPEGTGLGLYLTKSIVESSGGQIWFESEKNKGTTFYVALPLSGMKKKEGSKSLI